MLITTIIGDCPKCGAKNQYGNVSVQNDQVIRGCMRCDYGIVIPLPKIRKKILYLDQFFFSNSFKEKDMRFVEVAKRISDLSDSQLLVVPYSSIHQDETHQWGGFDGKNRDDLMEFIKSTSRGHKFNAYYEIENRQIIKAFNAFMRGKSPLFELQQQDVIPQSIHGWDDYFRIDVDSYFKDIEDVKRLKLQGVDELINAFDSWRRSTKTFEQDVVYELKSAAEIYVNAYMRYCNRIAGGEYEALIDSPIISWIVQDLLDSFSENTSYEIRMTKIFEFFGSEYFANIPYQWVSVRVFSVLKDMVKRGAYLSREKSIKKFSGFFQDIEHVSFYAPYCDAFFMDKAMAELVSDPRIDIENRYAVKVFSLNNFEVFVKWLDGLESEMTKEHRAGLVAAYP